MVLDRTISYRQVGGREESSKYVNRKKRTGRVRREASKDSSSSGTHNVNRASIPSKFETVLHFGPREANAFGNRCKRFGHDSVLGATTVGPGQYWNKPTLVKSMETCGSVSKKGYGVGFISKTKRFSNRKELESSTNPGPGDYAWSPSFSTRVDFSKAKSSSIFAQNKSHGAFGNLHKTPGPGAYNVNKKHNSRISAMPSSSFKNKFQARRLRTVVDARPRNVQRNGLGSPQAHSKKAGEQSSPRSSMFRSTTNRQTPSRFQE